MLGQQRIDIGLTAKPKTGKSLVFLPVMEIQDTFVATPSYLENLRLREGADADLFQTGNIMLLDKQNLTRTYIDDYMNANHIQANNLLQVTTMDLLIEFARIGLGIGCVIREFVRDDIDKGRLVEIRPESPIRKRTIGFVYHPGRPSKALDTFIRFCRECAPDPSHTD